MLKHTWRDGKCLQWFTGSSCYNSHSLFTSMTLNFIHKNFLCDPLPNIGGLRWNVMNLQLCGYIKLCSIKKFIFWTIGIIISHDEWYVHVPHYLINDFSPLSPFLYHMCCKHTHTHAITRNIKSNIWLKFSFIFFF